MINIREELRNKRALLQISLRQVEKALSISASIISKWERGIGFIQGFEQIYRQYLDDCESGKIQYTRSYRAGVTHRWKSRHHRKLEGKNPQINLPIQENTENSISMVNQPKHYSGKIEVIDFIDAHNLNFNLGNVVKYVARSGRKDGEDTLTALKKAQWYLNREIQRHEQVQQAIQQQD